MAGGKRGSGSAGGAGNAPQGESSRRPKRNAPTIDLTATDVTPQAQSLAAAKPQPEPSPAPEPSQSAESSRAESSRAEPPRAESPRTEAPRREAFTQPRGSASFAWRDALSTSTIAAGLIGALLVSLVMFMLWLTGMVPIRYAGSTAMRARVSVLEMQVAELTNRAPANGVSQKAADDIAQRLVKLEQDAKAPGADPKLMERLEAAENAMKALGVALTGINSRVEANAARVEAGEKAVADATRATATSDGALANRVETLEQASAAAAQKIAAAGTDERSAKLAVAASALREAVSAGEPFPAALAAVKSLGADGAALAPLEPFAAAGVPRDAVLARELDALLPAIRKTLDLDVPASGGFLDKLQANATKLVRVRPAGEVSGNDAAAVVARLEQKTAQNDVAGAVTELKSLPEASRAPAQAWIAKVEARRGAVEASRKLATDSLRALQ